MGFRRSGWALAEFCLAWMLMLGGVVTAGSVAHAHFCADDPDDSGVGYDLHREWRAGERYCVDRLAGIFDVGRRLGAGGFHLGDDRH